VILACVFDVTGVAVRIFENRKILGSKCRCNKSTFCTGLFSLCPNYCMTVTCFVTLFLHFQAVFKKSGNHVNIQCILLNNELWDLRCVHVE
jgi:hypothetical protein